MKYGVTFWTFFFSSLLFSTSAFAHTDAMAGSKWFFGKDRIVAVMEVGPTVAAKIPGIKEGHHNLRSCPDAELQEVAARTIQPYVAKNLSILVNGRPCQAKVVKVDRKSDIDWDIWLSADQVPFDQPMNQVKIDYRLLFDETDDTHVNLAYIYAYDAQIGAASDSIPDSAFIARNDFTTNSRIWEAALPGPTVTRPVSAKPFWNNVRDFVSYGIKHIWTGYDHIAFLLALIAIGLSIREVLKIITAFTIAHSITLLLATLQVISLNSRFVESVIAFSICYVALENILKKEIRYRWLITFGFGLIHGFGFASGLKELMVGKADLLSSILAFNLGVETGQLAIFFVLLPIFHFLGRRVALRKITIATSTAVFVMGFAWLVERLFNLPFAG